MLLIGFLPVFVGVLYIAFWMADVSRMQLNEPKAAKFEEIWADFCVFRNNAPPGLKLHFYEPYVMKSIKKALFEYFSSIICTFFFFFFFFLLKSRLQSHFVVVNFGVFWWWD